MIHVITATNCFVADGTNVFALGVGDFPLAAAHTIWTGGVTNALPYLRDGSTVLVDSVGQVQCLVGPDLWLAGSIGMATAAGTVGVILGIRFLIRSFLGMAYSQRSEI